MKKLFVTVGSTKFPELISQILTSEFISLLQDLQFSHLVVQAGSTTVPKIYAKDIEIQVYAYKDSIIEDMKDAYMIISHAGSGSILEALSMNKRLLVVVNDLLMDNHQVELANELSPDYLQSSNISDMKLNFIECYNSSHRKKWTAAEFTLLPIVKQELGI